MWSKGGILLPTAAFAISTFRLENLVTSLNIWQPIFPLYIWRQEKGKKLTNGVRQHTIAERRWEMTNAALRKEIENI
jgi:hypothetical protein